MGWLKPWWLDRLQRHRRHDPIGHAEGASERSSAELLGRLRSLTDDLEHVIRQREEEARRAGPHRPSGPQRRRTDPGHGGDSPIG